MKIAVVARDEAAAHRFRTLHSFLAERVDILLRQRSYFQCIDSLIAEYDQDVVCLVHDDVILPPNFLAKCDELLDELNGNWPNWGLVGNAGVGAARYGYAAQHVVRYLSDPHGGPNLAGAILPAQSIDGNVMLLNLRALRAQRVTMPAFQGFQLYDIALSIECHHAGLAVLVAPQLSCWHGSAGNQMEFNKSARSPAWDEYLTNRLENRRIVTLNGDKCIPLNANFEQRFGRRLDLVSSSLRNAATNRRIRSVGVVIRTQFRRKELLTRTLDSVRAFIAAAGVAIEWQVYIVTDAEVPPNLPQAPTVNVLHRPSSEEGRDSRYLLVQYAVEAVSADFLWFVDDDDWLFPNAAPEVADLVSCAPPNSLVFVDAQHYAERSTNGSAEASALKSEPGKYFRAADFFRSTSGFNHTPFSGVIYSTSLLRSIPRTLFESVVYFEDYVTTMYALFAGRGFPLVLDRLCVGISVRANGNTITELDRTTWNKSMAVVSASMANDGAAFQILSLGGTAVLAEIAKTDATEQVRALQGTIQEIYGSRSWRLTKPVRWFGRAARAILRREVNH